MANFLKKLRLFSIVGLIKARFKKIDEAKAIDVPDLNSYPQNILNQKLHPQVQYAVIKDIKKHSDDVKTFVFTPDEEKGTKEFAYFSAGSYISISVKIGDAVLTRPYSLSSSPSQALKGEYTLTIKRAPGGVVSNYVLDNLKVGDKIEVSAPKGELTYEPLRDAKTVIGIAGGSGITPFYSFAKAILEEDEDFNLILLYGSRTKQDILFLNELEEIASKTDKFKLINVLSHEEVEGYEHGFINAELIKKYAPTNEDYSIFLCGPQAMYNFVDQEIKKLNIRKKFVRHELFGEYHNPDKNEDYPKEMIDKAFKLTVKMQDETYHLDCLANETLMVTMEKNGLLVPSACRSGTCGYCHSRLISGNVYVPSDVDGRRKADLDYSYIHPCCTFPLSDLTIEVPVKK